MTPTEHMTLEQVQKLDQIARELHTLTHKGRVRFVQVFYLFDEGDGEMCQMTVAGATCKTEQPKIIEAVMAGLCKEFGAACRIKALDADGNPIAEPPVTH